MTHALEQSGLRRSFVVQLANKLFPLKVANRLRRVKRAYEKRGRPMMVPLDRLLMAGERGIPSAKYATLIGDLLRPSTPIAKSPHVKFLQQYLKIGDAIFHADVFEHTEYYRNAAECMELVGYFFEVKCREDIWRVAKDFVAHFNNCKQNGNPLVQRPEHTPPGIPVRVRPILHSECFQIIDGQHRCAIAYVRGEKEIRVLCEEPPVLTPLQQRLLDVMWTKGRRDLYQPIESPELEHGWVVIRRCTDRLAMMERFLQQNGLLPRSSSTYLDVGSSYGWFVAQMGKLGFDARGVERDPIAISLGPLVYGLRADQVARADCGRFLRECGRPFEVTSCFSLLHHFALGRAGIAASEFMRLLDKVTGQVLFLDTGQSNEEWFRERLSEWDLDFIEWWIKEHSAFTKIHRVGVDEDRVAPFEKNYSRTLFACTR